MFMEKKKKLPAWGQSLWMDNYSRQFLQNGSFPRYLEEFAITGVSLNSESLQKAIVESSAYDDAIRNKLGEGLCGETLACSLVIDDVRHAADLLRHVNDRTEGVDGWACLPASPFASDTTESLTEVFINLRQIINRPNVLIRLPASQDRISTIELLVYHGMPINITNIYSSPQFSLVAKACLRGIERRIKEHLKPGAPVFISVGIVQLEKELSRKMAKQKAAVKAYKVAEKVFATMRVLHTSQRWEATYNSGARPLRLIWNCSSPGDSSEIALATAQKIRAPYTIIILPRNLICPFLTTGAIKRSTKDPYDKETANRRDSDAEEDYEKIATYLQENAMIRLRNNWIMMLEGIAKKSAWVSQQKAIAK